MRIVILCAEKVTNRGNEHELEVPIICARKVETTPVPDLLLMVQGQRLGGDWVEIRLGDVTCPISRQSRGARERIASASTSSASKRTNVSSIFQGSQATAVAQKLGTVFLTCWFVDLLVVILGQM